MLMKLKQKKNKNYTRDKKKINYNIYTETHPSTIKFAGGLSLL